MSRLSTLALVLTVAVACGGKSTPPPATPLPPDQPAEPVAQEPAKPAEPPAPPPPIEIAIEPQPITIKLVKAGTGKKAKLVYASKVGDKTPIEIAFDFVQKFEAGTEKGEQVAPTVVLLTDAETKAADATTLDYQLTLTGIDARDAAGAKAGSAEEIKTALAGVTGITVNGKINTNGVASGAANARVEKGDEAGKQVLSLFQTALPQWPPLPAEAIGAGAKWQATQTTSIIGKLTVTHVTDYELVSRKGNTATIKGTIKVSGTDLVHDGAKISDIKGSGTTEATLVDGAYPTFKSSVETTFKVTDEKAGQTGTMGLKVGTAVTPKVAAAPAPATK